MDDLRKRLIQLFSIHVAFSISMQIIMSLFPLYLRSLNASEVNIGSVTALGSVFSMILMIPGGVILNKLGKKLMLIISIILSAVPPVFFGALVDWRLVAPFFIVFNIASAFFNPTQVALVAESAEQRNRARLFSVMNLAWPLGGIIGPFLSGYIVETLGWNQVFLTATAISSLSIIPALKLSVVEGSSMESDSTVGSSSSLSRRELFVLILFFLFTFSVTYGIAGVFIILPLFLKDSFNLSTSTIGLFFTVASLTSLTIQVPCGFLADKYGRKRMLILSILPVPVLFYIWGFMQNWLILIVLFSMAFSFWNMTWPPNLALLSESVPPERRGLAFGVMNTADRLGFTLGPLTAGYFYGTFNTNSPFILASFSSLISLFLAFLFKDSTG